MLEARLKDNYRWASIVALDGQEYIKTEWRPVPAVREDEAEQHPALELRERPEVEIVVPDASADAAPSSDLAPEVEAGLVELSGKPAKKVITAVEKADAEPEELARLAELENAKSRPRMTVLRAIDVALEALEAGDGE